MFRRKPSREFLEPHGPSRDDGCPSLGDELACAGSHRERVTQFLATSEELIRAYPSRKYLWSSYLPAARGSVLTVGVSKPNFGEWDLLEDPLNYWSIDIDPAVQVFAHVQHHTTVDLFDYHPQKQFEHVIAFGMFGARNDRQASDPHVDDAHVSRMICALSALVKPRGYLLLGPELTGRSLETSKHESDDWLMLFSSEPTLTALYTLNYALQDRCNLIAVFHKSR